MQPCKRRVRSPPGSPPAQGRSPPEQAQSEKSQGVRGTESPDSSINTKENRELRVRFFGGTTVNGLTPALVEESQLAGQFIIGFPSLEPIAMIIEQFTNELCIGAIIFGAPWTKGLTKAGYLTGIDWIEFQELVVHQMIDQRPATLLQTD